MRSEDELQVFYNKMRELLEEAKKNYIYFKFSTTHPYHSKHEENDITTIYSDESDFDFNVGFY